MAKAVKEVKLKMSEADHERVTLAARAARLPLATIAKRLLFRWADKQKEKQS